jgi:hypothetical protein
MLYGVSKVKEALYLPASSSAVLGTLIQSRDGGQSSKAGHASSITAAKRLPTALLLLSMCIAVRNSILSGGYV